MQRQAGPSSLLLTSVEGSKHFSKSQTEVRVIGFFSSTTDPKVIKTYMESGNEVRMDMELGHTTDEKIAQGMGFEVDTIAVFHSRYAETRCLEIQFAHMEIYIIVCVCGGGGGSFSPLTHTHPRTHTPSVILAHHTKNFVSR